MPYTRPNGNAANFSAPTYRVGVRSYVFLSGANYTPQSGGGISVALREYLYPLGSEANFGSAPQIPTVTFACSSATDFHMKVDEIRDFTFACATVMGMEQPYREIQIASSSSFVPNTWLRSPNISLGSTPLFRPGAYISFVSETALSLSGWAVIQRAYEIDSGSTNYSEPRTLNHVSFSSSGRTLTGLRGGKIQPLGFVVNTDTRFSFRTRQDAESAFSSGAKSTLACRAAAQKPAYGIVTQATDVAFRGRGYANAAADIQSFVTTEFLGQNAAITASLMSSGTAVSFLSSYVANPAPDEPTDIVYVRESQKQLFVRTLQ